jgi:hypothetical protein
MKLPGKRGPNIDGLDRLGKAQGKFIPAFGKESCDNIFVEAR